LLATFDDEIIDVNLVVFGRRFVVNLDVDLVIFDAKKHFSHK